MFERFTEEARDLVVRAVEHAIRLGHRYVGPEHILLAAVSTGQPASVVLRAHGVTPELVEEGIVGLGAGAGLFGGLDKDALATIGIDLDAVRARIEASFGPQALARAAQAAHRDPRRRRPQVGEGSRKGKIGRPPEATGRYCEPDPRPSGHIPFTPATKKILEVTLREAAARHDSQIGVEHIALALTTIKQGLVPQILSAAGAPAAALRAAILDRYRQAS